MAAGRQKAISLFVISGWLTLESTPSIHSARVGLSEETLNVFEFEKKLHSDCI